MVKKVKRYLEGICSLEAGDAVVVGVSGGADSVCLLCVLREIYEGTGVAIHAVHVNHNLRAEAADDQRYVEMLCSGWKIPCHCYSYDVERYASEHGISEEEAGRQLRYGAFYELQSQLTENRHIKIAVAHTMDDNAETMLLNLFRGTGMKGLRGIPVSRGDIIRPLLCARRSEIEAWLNTRGIGWRNDCSNDTDDYTRNKIRHKILPVAEKEINENAVLHMNRTAEQLALAEDYLADRVEEAWNVCVRPLVQNLNSYSPVDADMPRQFSPYSPMAADMPKQNREKAGYLILSEPLLALHPYLRSLVLLKALQRTAETARDIGAVHVEALERLFGLQCGRQLHLAYGVMAERTYKGVVLKKNETDTECAQEHSQDCGQKATKRNMECYQPKDREIGEAVIELKISGSTDIPGYGVFETRVFQAEKQNFCEIPKDRYTKWFDYDKIKDTLCIRTRQAGDYLIINADGDTQKLKSYLINQKIPGEEREKLLMIADGSHIMWVVGYRCSHGYYISETTEKILEIQYRQIG